jgi:hypothetical protein
LRGNKARPTTIVEAIGYFVAPWRQNLVISFRLAGATAAETSVGQAIREDGERLRKAIPRQIRGPSLLAVF